MGKLGVLSWRQLIGRTLLETECLFCYIDRWKNCLLLREFVIVSSSSVWALKKPDLTRLVNSPGLILSIFLKDPSYQRSKSRSRFYILNLSFLRLEASRSSMLLVRVLSKNREIGMFSRFSLAETLWFLRFWESVCLRLKGLRDGGCAKMFWFLGARIESSQLLIGRSKCSNSFSSRRYCILND